MKASNANKVISVLLSVAMCPMMVPTAAFAADDGTASGASTAVEQAQPADQAEASGTGANSGNTLAAKSEAAEAATGEAAAGEAAAPAAAPAAAAGETAGEEAAPAAAATINGYSTFGEAVQNATADAQGVITYEVTGKVNVDSTGWVQVRSAGATDAKVVKFVGKSADAEICITQGVAILADQGSSALSVEFSNLKLSKLNPKYAGDYGQATEYFTTWLRNTDAASNCVTYTNCEFPNGVCNNQYGKTVFDSCKFTNTVTGFYNMWVYGGNVEVSGGSFTGVRGVKVYTEGTATVAPKVDITGASFTGISEKAAIVVSKPATVTLSNVSATTCAKGLIQKAIGNSEKVTLDANGTGIGGNFGITANTGSDATKAEFNLNAGTLTSEVSSDFLADGFTLSKSSDGTFGVAAGIAEVNGKGYSSLQKAIDAAPRKATVKLLADTTENVTISTPYVTLDLNGHTLNGSTGERKPALTVTARITVMDSSEAKTGTIMREDTAENSGVSSHYVIDVQGDGWLTFESGNVTNNSGAGGTKGASLVRVGDDSVAKYPGLNIKGGNFTQNNFIVIKVDRGNLFLNGGTLNSAKSYAIENWHRATVKGGTVNGAVAAWTYSGGLNSDLTISGGTINGDVTSVNYGSAEGKVAKVSISGGTVNGALDTRSYDPSTNELTSIDDATKATIEVTSGTFSTDPSRYLIEGSTATPNTDGTFGVEKAYLAQVGATSYYTMDEAFKAQTASGEAITLLRDYTTGSTFNSGTVARVVDLNGHTWTCTGTDANSAAFEINNPDASLTVKNGKIVSSQLIGLIPSASAMGGTITYDNSTLTFEGVEATTTATSGIETNGNNTNDAVVLKNSTLNVPNGFGIYFPSSGTLTIDNSKINAKTMGAQVCSGNLNVNSGSTITVSGDPVDKLEGDGAIQDGAAISIVNRLGYKGLGKIAITGGTFTAKDGNAALKAYTWDSSTKQESAFDNSAKKVAVSGGTFSSAVSADLCAEGFAPVKNEDGTYDVKEETRGTEARPYTLAELGAMTRAEYVAAQEALDGTMYVEVGDYSYDKNGVLGNGERNDTPGQNPDHSKLNAYGENGYLNENNDGANGKNIVFVNGNITSGATGYTSIDNIGTSLLLAVPAYTNVTFKGITFNNVMSFDYQLYTSPWSQLGELKFDGCTFNGIIVGAIAAQTLTFNGCTFTNYTNTTSANNSNPTWIRPAYGNWTAGDNKGQGDNFQSLTKINFTGNTVTSTRPVKFEYISQWDIRSKVTVTDNSFDISAQKGDTAIKNVGLYLGAHTNTNAFDLVAEGNTKSDNTAALYTIPKGETSLPLGSTVKNTNGEQIELTDALKWKAADAEQDKIVLKTVKAVASVGDSKYQSLAEAIAAAKDGQTVTLLADATEDVAISKSITLDLGGKTLTNTNAGKATISVQGGTVTVKNGNVVGGTGYYNIEVTKDSNANLTLADVAATAGNTGSSMIDNWGTLTIESGSYTGGMNTVKSEEGSTLTINGGTFTCDFGKKWSYTAVILVYGTTTINGGEFIQKATNTSSYAKVVMTGKVDGYEATTKVTGGKFVNEKLSGIFWALGKATSDNFEVSGGTFNKSVSDSYFADGLSCVKNADGTYGAAVAIAQIGSVNYASLQAAINAAKSGKTVTLLTDIVLDAQAGTESTLYPQFTISGKKLTLDMQGHKISYSEESRTKDYGKASLLTLSIDNGSDVTITGNGTIDTELGSNQAYGINILGGSNLTINNGTFYGAMTAVQVQKGGLVINDGTFLMSPTCKEQVPQYAKYIINCIDKAWKDGSATVSIKGGTFGHDYSHSPEGEGTSYLAPGYAPTNNGDGTYGVVAGVAQIGAKAYASLQAAIDAAQAGETIQLLNDTAENIEIAKTKQITLDLNGHTLNGGTGTAKAAILNEGNVTITDTSAGKTGTIMRDDQGIEGETSYYVIRNIGTMVIDQANVVNNSGYKKANPSGSMVGSSLICNGDDDQLQASLTINGGTFTQPNFLVVKNGTNGTLAVNGGTLTSNHSAVQNWNKAQILGGSLTGQIWTDAWVEGAIGETVIGGNAQFTGEIVVDITGEIPPTLKIEGGKLDVTKWRVTNAAAAANATVAVSGGTFTAAVPENYCAAGYAPTKNADGTYGVKLAEGAYLLQDYRSGDQTSWTYPTKEGMAFAGWYKDAAFETPCTKSDVEGAAYAKFVKITDLLQFRGGSLRMDVAQPSELTWLRFGYTMALPEGASFVENGWYFKKVTTSQPTDVRRVANNNVLNIDGTITANLVFTGVTTNYYSANFSEKAFVKYVTADGTAVEAVEGDYQVRSVLDVAKVILAHPMASKAEKDYATQIMAAV